MKFKKKRKKYVFDKFKYYYISNFFFKLNFNLNVKITLGKNITNFFKI